MRTQEIVSSCTEKADFYDLESAAKMGRLLPCASARLLEEIIPSFNPGDVVNRARLLGHYWQYYERMNTEADEVDLQRCNRRAEHILWFIKNAPDCIFAGDYYLSCDPIKDEAHYETVKAAWNKQVKARPTCTQTRINFALFLLIHDSELAIRILNETLKLAPLNEWALSLLCKLKQSTTVVLPLAVSVIEPSVDREILEKKLFSAHHIVRQTPSLSLRTSKASVNTQERILLQDPFDLWARLDILRWCQRNMDRANLLGFDPTVAQTWFRHVSWILLNCPHAPAVVEFQASQFGFGMQVPDIFFEPIKELFLAALEQPVSASTFDNAIAFFSAHLPLEETKKLICTLNSWKRIDRPTRRKMLRELTNNYSELRYKSIFDTVVDLDSVSEYAEITEQSTPFPRPQNSIDLHLYLGWANYEGSCYTRDCFLNLDQSMKVPNEDLINAARLVGYYNRHYEKLTPEQVLRMDKLCEAIRPLNDDDQPCCTSELQPKSFFNTNGAAYEAICKNRIEKFHSNANLELAKLFDNIQSHWFMFFECPRIPIETVWTNEQVLNRNPNDVLLRSEILQFCEDHEPNSVNLSISRIRTEHLLWMLENVPHSDLYFLLRHHWGEHPSYTRIIDWAVRRQRKAYGKKVAKYRPEFPRKKKQSENENRTD